MGSIFSRRRRESSRTAETAATRTQQPANAQNATTAATSPPANQAGTSTGPAPSATESVVAEAPAQKESTPIRVEVERADTEEVEIAPDATAILEPPPLFEREWNVLAQLNEEKFSFTMMNFNLLADALSGANDHSSSNKNFVRVPLEFLEWNYRGPKIVEEILRWSPDVLCTEECDRFEFLLGELQKEGYDGRFKPKEWSPVLKMGDGTMPPDGVAIFWKPEKFDLVGEHQTVQERHRINTADAIAKAAAKASGSEEADPSSVVAALASLDIVPGLLNEEGKLDLIEMEKLFKKQGARTMEWNRRDLEIAPEEQFVDREAFEQWLQKPPAPVSKSIRLRPKDERAGGAELGFLATHLVSLKELTGEIHRQRQLVALLHDEGHMELLEGSQMFLGCDMNAAPVDAKGYPPLAYRYIVGKPVAGDSGDEADAKVDVYETPFKSAMRGDGDNEIGYSTWKHREKQPGKEVEDKHTIDYLFLPPDGWRIIKTLGVPTEMDISQERRRLSTERHMGDNALPSALPSARYPSDHFSICAQFEMS